MRLSVLLISGLTFVAAAGISLAASGFIATAVEESSEIAVRGALDSHGHDWTEVEADGLRVILTGTAPDEATRFNAVTTVAEVVDTTRIIDQMDVEASKALAPPRFSVEILRNASGISMIGLIPAATDRDALVERLEDIARPAPVSDLMEVADYPVPDGWEDAMAYTLSALSQLPRSKVSIGVGQVTINAVVDSPEARKKLEDTLNRAAHPGLNVRLEISAPRPVITPFTLRYIIDDEGGRFDACSADTEEARERILVAAEAAGNTTGARCVIGLGVPSPNWAEAAVQALNAVGELGAGSVTFADADVTLVAQQGTDPALFDRVVGELEADLPSVFVLHAVLPEPESKNENITPEFTATLSPEGLVQLRGRLNDENLQRMADSYAKARFGSASVYSAARTAEGLPGDWPVRVLSGIEALSRLVQGVVVVTPESLKLRGIANDENASAEISGLLADRLGENETYDLEVAYQPPPPPADEPKTPEMCEADIAEVQRSTGKITFEPGSATIAAESLDTMNAIADILAECGDLRIEIQGHTDSQGRESMNQRLSQDRAQSVLNELRARRILTSSYTAKGYGEANPIADNGTEAGRENNRRIEFRLILPEPTQETPSTLDAVAREAAAEHGATEEDSSVDDAADTAETTPDAETEEKAESPEEGSESE